jgi:hypothetical protein
MQAGLVDEDSSRPNWIQLDFIDLTRHVTWETAAGADYEVQFRKSLQEQLHTWFTELSSRPGWRIHVLRQRDSSRHLDVIFCWHHAFFDGMSAKIFHQTLLKNLNDAKAQELVPGLDNTVLKLVDTAKQFPPPPETLRKINVTLGFTAAMVWRELKPPFLVRENPTDANWAPIRSEPYGTESRLIIIDAGTLKKLLAACRKHQTTLTGLLNALPLLSLSQQLDAKKVTALSSVLALDLRRFMPSRPRGYLWHVPDVTMDNEVTLVEQDFGTDIIQDIRSKAASASSAEEVIAKVEDTAWAVAVSTRGDIQRKLESDLKNDLLGLMTFVKDWREQMRSKLAKPRARSWGVTNLGVLDRGSGDWTIDRAVFRLSAEVNAPAFHISAVSVKGGDLCIDVGWQIGILDKAIGDKLAADIEAYLRYLAEHSA